MRHLTTTFKMATMKLEMVYILLTNFEVCHENPSDFSLFLFVLVNMHVTVIATLILTIIFAFLGAEILWTFHNKTISKSPPATLLSANTIYQGTRKS